jgi:hypothetical protein
VCKCVMYCCHRVLTECVMYCCHRVLTECVMYCCHRVSNQLRLNIYIYIYIYISYNILLCISWKKKIKIMKPLEKISSHTRQFIDHVINIRGKTNSNECLSFKQLYSGSQCALSTRNGSLQEMVHSKKWTVRTDGQGPSV